MRWWRIRALLTLPVIVAAQVAALIMIGPDAFGWLWLSGPLAVGVLIYATVVPPLLFRIHRWEVTDEAVYTMSGWPVVKWRIAPISRVQTVDTARGPLQQLLGIANVTVTTASARGPVTIDGLDARTATALARTLTEATGRTPGDAT
jgi:membrane protein YdbS with pleckstrin-like domain